MLCDRAMLSNSNSNAWFMSLTPWLEAGKSEKK